MTPFLRMAQNNAWANATLYAAMTPLDTTGFAAPRPGFFPSLQATMNHIYEVDLYYIDALQEGGRGRRVYDRAEVADPQTLAALQAEADDRLIAFCAALAETRALSRVRTERAHDPEVTERVDMLLLHLFQHQIHHRGQAHVQLQEAGIAPPQLDEFFLDDDRAPGARIYWA
ncbi:DinB family protein [Pseudooceanicola sp. C21-150M6]|uniref:DinB family protein n=1 Tax=Pseudooceanicola sp. C21-150M6 TaxID=3434355 RepID=UPI003D7F433A